MEKILVTGSKGQLGLSVADISYHYLEQYYFYYTDIEDLDITSFDDVFNFCKQKEITIIINAAAYTAVDLAENFPEKCFAINRDGVRNLAIVSEKLGIFFVHTSTDYIFDGESELPYKEDDLPNPISIYGQSKLEGELVLKSILKKGVIIRTSWLYSIYGKNFLKTMLELSKKQKEIQVVADQFGTPTCASDLAEVIMEIIKKKEYIDTIEVFHYSNSGSCTWYEFASFIISKAGLNCQVTPINSTEYKTKAKRPKHSEFNKGKVKNFLGIEIPKWELSAEKTIKKLE
jgi:dTDP-4-dehydrorhamnose reductase